jgi:iron complex transport system permease protein
LIVGLMTLYLCEGLVGVVLHFTEEPNARVFASWNDGSFANVTWSQSRILIPLVAAGLVVSGLMVKPLNALLLGENYARTLGLTVQHARLCAFASTAILAGVVTAYCGPVVFLGVAIPHLCRGIFNTSDHRILLPAVILLGSMVALAADLVTHLPWERHVLHLNTVNALIGAPVVLWVVLRQRRSNDL